MSRALSQVRRMRIIALPLTSGASSSGNHIYYHFQNPPAAEGEEGSSNLLKKATGKAAAIWAGFGKAPEGTWKHRVFAYGEKIVDRIDFEELALKSMDPSLGPKISELGTLGTQIEKEGPTIPLIHPSKLALTTSPLVHLRNLLSNRTPSHRKGFYFWLLISPFTAPFMLIPVIPNLPFFFCAWRSWHHYKAYKASTYLESLLMKNVIVPQPNIGLDKIYDKYRFQLTRKSTHASSPPTTPSPTSTSSEKISNPPSPETSKSSSSSQETLVTESHTQSHSSGTTSKETLILNKEAVPRIVAYFDLPSTAESDLYRALDQTATRLKKEQGGLP